MTPGAPALVATSVCQRPLLPHALRAALHTARRGCVEDAESSSTAASQEPPGGLMGFNEI